MHVTRGRSKNFDPARVVDPDHRGGVAWDQFNESFERLQKTPWRRVNEGKSHGFVTRMLRLALAYKIQKGDAILDFRGKARAFSQCPIPRDPNIVFFGAEVGWEALLLQALFGDGGKVVLIDNDPAAYDRFLHAPTEMRTLAPRGFPSPELVIRRDASRIEYLREDFFDVERSGEFDVGVDWGLLEHFGDDRKLAVMKKFRSFLKPGGLQLSSCPRNSLGVRLFYHAFRDEMNFGYRELMSLKEFRVHLEAGGYEILHMGTLPAHNIVVSRSGQSDPSN